MEQAIGEGLRSFANIEMFMAHIFSWVMHPAPQRVSMIVFDRARHLNAKVAILRGAAQERLTAKSYRRLDNILNRVTARGEVRHKLAHWTIGYWHADGKLPQSVAEATASESRLMPNWMSEKNLDFNPSETLSLADIKEFSLKCVDVGNALVAFTIDIQGWMHLAYHGSEPLPDKIGEA
jgi:hypothetical protein